MQVQVFKSHVPQCSFFFFFSFLNYMGLRYSRTSHIAQLVKNLPAMQETLEVLQKKGKKKKSTTTGQDLTRRARAGTSLDHSTGQV